MVITTTVVARCDREECETTHFLANNTTQMFRDLAERGWTFDHVTSDEGILTYCPLHPVGPVGEVATRAFQNFACTININDRETP